MNPIHIKGKEKTEASSYRQISLTSCIVNVLERIINTRLKCFLESEKLHASEQTLTVWIDLQKAFDTVWTDGLLLKLNMFRWIKSYLHNRRTRVVIDNTKSNKILLRHGVPQGGVISPTLFLVFINDIIKKCPSPMRCTMYADYLVL